MAKNVKVQMTNIRPGGLLTQEDSSRNYKTGNWRQGERPQFNAEKCKQCFICVHFCPEDAFIIKNGKVVGINYQFCKGCGICAKECPSEAIKMVEEKK